MTKQFLYIAFVIGMLCLQFLAPKCSAAKPFGVLHNLLDYALGRRARVGHDARPQTNATFVAVEDPESVVKMVERSINDSRRQLADMPCGTGNPIDDCWRCDPNWEMNRQRLADCAIGFGRTAIGGKNGRYYLVTDPSDNDAVNPVPGTLRHAVIQTEPLWIIFQRDMIIRLKEELIMNSFKTIDGRGVNVHIANGPCITIQYVTHIIIHGISIHDCIPGGNAMVRDSPTHYGWRTVSDGDGISIFGGSHIWIDHCSLSNCKDGLIDAIMGSTAITISNNHFSQHNEVMLLGHSDTYTPDVIMQVTIAFNQFGEGLVQRMPRCRHGYFHVVNNEYTHWEMYAIGGSANPTINSQGNRYHAPVNPNAKEVTKRLNGDFNEWRTWNWRSEGDEMINGAFFIPSGAGAASSYAKASSLGAMPAAYVAALTVDAGVLMNINRGMSLTPPNPIVSGGNPFIPGGNPFIPGGNPMLSGADILLADRHYVFHLSFAFFVSLLLLTWSIV